MGKVKRYILYGLGEILLVVIGILIALQVNTWNEGRKERKAESQTLHGLLAEFQACQNEIQRDIVARERILRISSMLQQHHLDKAPLAIEADSMETILDLFLAFRFYSPTHPVLDDLQSSGRLDLLRSDSLRLHLIQYIQEKDRVHIVEENERAYVENQLIPFLASKVDLTYAFSMNDYYDQVLAQVNALHGQTPYGGMIYQRIDKSATALRYSQRLEELINTIISDLQE